MIYIRRVKDNHLVAIRNVEQEATLLVEYLQETDKENQYYTSEA